MRREGDESSHIFPGIFMLEWFVLTGGRPRRRDALNMNIVLQ